MLNIVISGAPGSGKGTQSDLIVEKYELKHLSTGDMLRAEIARGSEIGRAAEGLIAKGEFVPDEMITGMLEAEIDKNSGAAGFIFDGFPRTVAQAEALDELLAKRGEKVDVMIDVVVPSEELVKRILLRGQTSGRADDNLETVRQRIRTFEQKTLPVMQYYEKRGKHRPIKGDEGIDEVFASVCQTIEKELSGKR